MPKELAPLQQAKYGGKSLQGKGKGKEATAKSQASARESGGSDEAACVWQISSSARPLIAFASQLDSAGAVDPGTALARPRVVAERLVGAGLGDLAARLAVRDSVFPSVLDPVLAAHGDARAQARLFTALIAKLKEGRFPEEGTSAGSLRSARHTCCPDSSTSCAPARPLYRTPTSST